MVSSSVLVACARVAAPKRVDCVRSCTPRAAAESCNLEAGALPELSSLGPLPLVAPGLASRVFLDGASGPETVGFPTLSGTASGPVFTALGLPGFDPDSPVPVLLILVILLGLIQIVFAVIIGTLGLGLVIVFRQHQFFHEASHV